MEKTEEELNQLLEHVGTEGKFQKKFNLLYNLLLMLVVAMATMNIVLALTTPEHWCHVPERNRTNFTLQEWKQHTIPRVKGESSEEEFSKCSMYNITVDNFEDTNSTVACIHGWDYDNTWYTKTIPSQENWVCDRETYIPNTLSLTKVGEVIGTLIIGQLGDTIGRRPVMFFGITILIVGRCLATLFASHYVIFLMATILAGLQTGVVFQVPLIIGTEISSVRLRAQIALLQCVGWTSGMCLMPLIAWTTGGSWKLFTLITTLPCAAIFIVYRTFPESPRWLATKGKSRKCLRVLEQIARENGTVVPENALYILQNLKSSREKVYGLASLCSSRQLLRNTVLICTCLTLAQLVSFSIVLTVANMSGNPFINMFLQALVELPAYLVGKVICDRYGRRWSQAGANLVSAVFQFICIAVVSDQNLLWLLIILVLVVKFCITVAAYCAYLQCMEIFPTCLRQTGTSVGVLVAMGIGSVGPYIVFLGTAVDARYPYAILGFLCLLGIVCSILMPETLNQKLPETLQDSAKFGKDQDFWNFPWKSRNHTYRTPPTT